MVIDNSMAILAINPKAAFGMINDDVNTIEWLDGTSIISAADIAVKRKELEEKEEEQIIIDKNDFNSGKAKLKALGLTDKEIIQLLGGTSSKLRQFKTI